MQRADRPTVPLALLGAWLAVLVAISWQRWGNPVSDPGLDLVVARDWLDGVVPYRDVRYWYGPLGIGGLSLTFAVLGPTLGAAFAYGLAQTLVITALCWALARRWLAAWPAAASVAVILAIGFSGSLFNFQLPHTAAATVGLAALLATLLALAAGRPWLAGVAIGLSALTRPEFLAFALVALAGAALGTWRGHDRPAVQRSGLRAAALLIAKAIPGALLIAAPVLAWFAHQAGAERLFTENLFPVDFVRTVGTRFEQHWHPYDLVSVGSLLLRGALVAGGALALLRSLEGWRGARAAGLSSGPALRRASAPWLLWLAVVAAAAATSLLLGLPQGEPTTGLREVADDLTRLLLAMTALPAIAFGALAAGALAWWRREASSPLGGSWPGDAALLATAAACALRAYNEFSTDVYATYYAPPAVLVAVILLWRAAARLDPAKERPAQPVRRWLPDGARERATTAIVAIAALTLTAHAYVGRYADQRVLVSSPHGSYRASEASGRQIQAVVNHLRGKLREGEPMLVLPQEPGFHFLLGTRPALYNATFLPGTLHDREADSAEARALLERPPNYVIIASRRLDEWGFEQSGVDFNQALHRALAQRYCVDAAFGDVARPPASELPAEAFTVLRLRPDRDRGGGAATVLGDGEAAPPPAPCSAP